MSDNSMDCQGIPEHANITKSALKGNRTKQHFISEHFDFMISGNRSQDLNRIFPSDIGSVTVL